MAGTRSGFNIGRAILLQLGFFAIGLVIHFTVTMSVAQEVSFSTITQIAAGSRSVAIGDLDGDEDLDLVMGSVIFKGDGNGTFTRGDTIDTGSGETSFVAIGDIDNDEDLDLAIAKLGISINDVVISLNEGDGTFGIAENYDTGQYHSQVSLAIGDLNRDGNLDLATANEGSPPNPDGTVSVLLGNGDGTFDDAAVYPVGQSPYSVAIGDLNTDGIPDLAVSYGGSGGNIAVFLGKGEAGESESFEPVKTFRVGEGPNCIAIGDLNEDNKPDLVTANSAYTPEMRHVSILVGDGDRIFREATHFSAPTTPSSNTSWSVAIGDLNKDGHFDLATGNTSDFSDHVSILCGDGNGNFESATNFGVPGTTWHGMKSVAIGDFNNDNKPDIVAVSYTGAFILLNDTPFDSDNDGIFDDIDQEPDNHSNEFSDGTTSGRIIDSGDQILTITDDPDDGIVIKADCSGGTAEAEIEITINDSVIRVTLNACSEISVGPGSAMIKIIKGSAGVTLYVDGWTLAKANIVEGNIIRFDSASRTLSADSANANIVVFNVEGREYSLSPGESTKIEKCPLLIGLLLPVFIVGLLLGLLICWLSRRKKDQKVQASVK